MNLKTAVRQPSPSWRAREAQRLNKSIAEAEAPSSPKHTTDTSTTEENKTNEPAITRYRPRPVETSTEEETKESAKEIRAEEEEGEDPIITLEDVPTPTSQRMERGPREGPREEVKERTPQTTIASPLKTRAKHKALQKTTRSGHVRYVEATKDYIEEDQVHVTISENLGAQEC